MNGLQAKTDIRSLIREKEQQLVGKKRRIAKYILDNHVEAAFLTAAELAKRAGVSEPTVVRFAKDFGFKGYPELQDKIQDLVQREFTTINRLKEYHRYLEDSENPAVKTLLMDLRNLEETLYNLDFEQLEEVIEKIINADKIIIVAFLMFSPLAEHMKMVLRRVRDNVTAITSSPGLFYDELTRSSKDSLVIGLSFPRYSRNIVECLQATKKEGVTTVAITDSELSPLAEYADYLLLVKCRLVSYIDSLTAPVSLIGAIGTALSLKLEQKTLKQLEKLEKLWKEYQVFH
jgi:DNA-binding MurR/RpiR family transcriptional regulator